MSETTIFDLLRWPALLTAGISSVLVGGVAIYYYMTAPRGAMRRHVLFVGISYVALTVSAILGILDNFGTDTPPIRTALGMFGWTFGIVAMFIVANELRRRG